MKVNMRDVANYAGVSVATVSHVINNTRFVSEATRQRVMEAIQKLEYSPNVMARIFKTGKKNLIGFIVPDIANRFFATIIEEVEAIIAQHNFNLIVANTKETKQREIENIHLLTSGIVDGLIVASTLEDFSEVEKIVPDNFPMVFIDRLLPHCPCDSVTISDYDSIYHGMESLIVGGHRKIGYIAGLKRLSTTSERLKAYRQALSDYHLPQDEKLIQYTDSMAKSTYACVDKLIADGCTAMIASNNVMTIDTLRYLNEHNIRVNQDISLIGYSGDEWAIDFFPNIDYISQPITSMGKLAGTQMIKRLANPQMNKKNIILYSALVKRA